MLHCITIPLHYENNIMYTFKYFHKDMHHDMIYSVGTITSHTLCRAQQHLTIESRSIGPPFFDFVYSVGKGVVALNIWNRCLTAPITRSTWILTLANLRVSSTSTAGNWAFPLVNTGTALHLCMPRSPVH